MEIWNLILCENNANHVLYIGEFEYELCILIEIDFILKPFMYLWTYWQV